MRPATTLVSLALMVACSGLNGVGDAQEAPTTEPPSTTVPASVSESAQSHGPSTSTSSQLNLFQIGPRQARLIATVIGFVDAYNRGSLDRTLASFAEEASAADCLYWQDARMLVFEGEDEIAEWLEGQFADHDQLEIEQIYNGNPEADSVVGVSWARRTSDSLADLGYPDGIHPQLAAKVVFDAQGLITNFANAARGRCLPSE